MLDRSVGSLFDSGFWTPGRLGGVPIRLHWSLPVGALVFGRFDWVPGFWLGFFVLILVHELGHAFLVKRRGLSIREVRIHGMGGVCMHEAGTRYDHAIIAWGGVLAQLLVLLVPAYLVWRFVALPPSPFLAELFSALIYTNLLLAAFNLLPVGGLDGATAWQLPRLWRARRTGTRRESTRRVSTRRVSSDPPRTAPHGKREAAPVSQPPLSRRDAEATAKEIARKALDDARRRR